MARILTIFLACCAVIFAPACERGKRSPQSQPAPKKAPSQPEAKPKAEEVPVGVVHGVVKLQPGAKLPFYTPKMMRREVTPSDELEPMPEGCSPAKDADRQPVKLTEQGTLAGVMLAASAFSKAATRPPITHDVVIEDCRLKPALVVATLGDQLRIRSSSNYPFMPELGAAVFSQTLIQGQEKTLKLDRPGVHPLLCGFTAACGRADVVVLYHPVYAVTDDKGEFTIDKFPAGETVTLNAWHPLFRESNINVNIKPGETRQVELTLSPEPQYVNPATAEKPTPKAGRASAGKRGAKRKYAPLQ